MSLIFKGKNLDSPKDFVKISTTCSLDGVNFTSNFPFTNEIKDMILICFILACMIGFVARYLSLILLVKRIGACGSLISTSFNKDCSQPTLVDTSIIALHFVLTLERATTLCLDKHHETILSPK